ncbi:MULTISPECIES: CRISPR-associated protein Csx16 [Methylomicrobium]|uniref:Putative CRISPR-associated protein, VVA1548 family n=1 Tax=Methylomicrobium album BG8 TaxID=686340 RepID=H8GGR5_METAL|nr:MULTISPECIES: CRISPR-associated protein Csx16 [Methylomicrobium]EIC30028.1 putative CRISPR-associated protein, VVA1548 family [Methylomicrobium album BG8]
MTTYFITRHSGAIDWARQQGIVVDHQLAHLDIDMIDSGDTVIGSLPVNLVAEVCEKGASYIHLSLRIPEDWRGRELTAEQMVAFGAKLERYRLKKSDEPLQ